MARILLALLCVLSAHAALITSAPPGGSTTVVGTGTGCSGGSIGSFSVVTISGPVCWPNSQFFGLTNNGSWNNFGQIGTNDATASFTLDLGALFSSAGFFMNYNLPLPGAGPILSAIANDGITILESYDIDTLAPISTPNGLNAGAFRGISRPSADIRFIKVGNAFSVVHSITVANQSTAVPEPATFLLLAPALFYLRRRHSC